MNPIETLHLSQRDKRRLVSQINQNSKAAPGKSDRRSLRVEFNVGHMVVTVTHPNRSVAVYSVAPRNLSRRGIAFIHGQFIYVDSACTVMLPMRDQRWASIPGKVVGCRHLSGLMHEISVAFKKDIDLPLFVELTADQEQRLKREINPGQAATNLTVPPSDAVRQAIVVVDDVAVRHLTSLWLQQLGFQTIEAGHDEVEKWLATKDFDLVLVDLAAHQGRGERLIRKVCAAKFTGLVMAISADGREKVREGAIQAGASAFLEAPFTHMALQESLDALTRQAASDAQRAEAEALYPSVIADPQMRPLLEEFVATLADAAQSLHDAFRTHDTDTVLRLCRQLKGSGGSYGFEPITETAKLAIACLEAQEHDLQAIKHHVDELVGLLHRARVA